MKNKSSLIVHIHSSQDIDKITDKTKYINLDINNINEEIIEYFIKYGSDFMYADFIGDTPGYIYVNYQEFIQAEEIIELIYQDMPGMISEIEIAKYLYVTLGKIVSVDINSDNSKNDYYNLGLATNINNLWGSLATGLTTDISIAKIYYYLCIRAGIKNSVVLYGNNIVNELYIDRQTLMVNLLKDIPFIQANMKTRYFSTYNDDELLDKNINYLKNRYNDYYLDKALKNIDYMREDCVYTILNRTVKLFNINKIKPGELRILYEYIFNKYCPNYNIKINNLYLNNRKRKHFIIISYNLEHYSYNYQKKCFVKVSDFDIIDNIKEGKIGLYLNEFIPNINIV